MNPLVGKPGSGRTAQVLIEFALCLPLCVALFLGVADLGFYLYRVGAVNAAVRGGLEAAITLGLDDQGIRRVVRSTASRAGLADHEISITRREATDLGTLPSGTTAEWIEIRVQAAHPFLVPMPVSARESRPIAAVLSGLRCQRR